MKHAVHSQSYLRMTYTPEQNINHAQLLFHALWEFADMMFLRLWIGPWSDGVRFKAKMKTETGTRTYRVPHKTEQIPYRSSVVRSPLVEMEDDLRVEQRAPVLVDDVFTAVLQRVVQPLLEQIRCLLEERQHLVSIP